MDACQYGAICEKNWELNLEELGEYRRITTFYSDLSIGEYVDGVDGVKETYCNVCKYWIGDYKYFTEFIMCLNHKSWAHYKNVDGQRINMKKEDALVLSKLYSDLYYRAKDLYEEHYKNDKAALRYFYEVMD